MLNHIPRPVFYKTISRNHYIIYDRKYFNGSYRNHHPLIENRSIISQKRSKVKLNQILESLYIKVCFLKFDKKCMTIDFVMKYNHVKYSNLCDYVGARKFQKLSHQ